MNTLDLLNMELKKRKKIPYSIIIYNTRNAIKITLMNIYNDTFKCVIYNSDDMDTTTSKIQMLVDSYIGGGDW